MDGDGCGRCHGRSTFYVNTAQRIFTRYVLNNCYTRFKTDFLDTQEC